ncbi:MAG: L,D-transpeptidase [Pseudomonadota bacterium]
MFVARLRTAAAFAALVVTALSSAIVPAHAQGFFLFDWGNTTAAEPQFQSSARLVAFPSRFAPGQIFVSFGDRQLYWVTSRGRAIAYPIASPRAQSAWTGVLRVSAKKVNPAWTPTAAMRRENPRLPAFVPGGHPQNPLGNRALYLGSTLYRIHGTDAPWTIGRPVSKGCVRMHNRDVADLYRRVPIGTKVTATYKRFRVQQPAAFW